MKVRINELLAKIIPIFINGIYFPFLSDKQFICLEYFLMMKKPLNLKNPKTFSEKIQIIKIKAFLKGYSNFVDKYAVREIIAESIGSKYLIPLIGVWDNPENINFDILPDKFVLKATHGSHQIYVCKNKSLINRQELICTMNLWLKEDFYKKTREIQYKDCPHKIICEKYLEDNTGDLPDYKFFCFNGEPYFVEILFNRRDQLKCEYRDMNWKLLNISTIGDLQSDKEFIKPDEFEEMVKLAKKLSKNSPFLRVDLYYVNGAIYFGELTYTPASGYQIFTPPEINYQLGNLIDLSKYTIK